MGNFILRMPKTLHDEPDVPARFLAQVKFSSPEQAAEQKAAFAALLARLGPEATEEEVACFLSERARADPEPALAPEAVRRLKERIAQIR